MRSARVAPLVDATARPGTHVGGMLAQVRDTMTDITGQPASEIAIRDVLAVDTLVPAEVRGGLAGEVALENAVALAAMVRTSRSRMQAVADRGRDELGCRAAVGGIEGAMAVLGALTTPGASSGRSPSSTSAAARPTPPCSTATARASPVHVAGAGELVTKLIDAELAPGRPRDRRARSSAIRWRRWRASSTSATRTARSSSSPEPLPPQVFARVVTLARDGPSAVPDAARLVDGSGGCGARPSGGCSS